jgi:glycosyltransferase involved in cell wall biosynthesis
MKLSVQKTVTVITPSIGKPELSDCMKSVQNQTYPCKHLIVVDGDHHNGYDVYVEPKKKDDVSFVTLSENTGANGYNGQRIYAAFPHLVNTDYVAFLDEDNWYEPNHIESLVETIEKDNLDFAYSLRGIYSKTGEWLVTDDCESLGKWPIFMSHKAPQGPQYLIDTSSYLFKRYFIQKTCHLWHSGPWGEDRRYFYYAKDLGSYDTNGLHTLCYRLGGNPNSVTEDFFIQGNKLQSDYYGGTFPWLKH